MTDEAARRATLLAIHERRWKAHWGPTYDTSKQPWPKTDAEWRQTPHGAPWDANVHMAEWHLKFARSLADEGLIEPPVEPAIDETERVARSICATTSGGFCCNVGAYQGCKVGRGEAWNGHNCAATRKQLQHSREWDAATAALAAADDDR